MIYAHVGRNSELIRVWLVVISHLTSHRLEDHICCEEVKEGVIVRSELCNRAGIWQTETLPLVVDCINLAILESKILSV